MRAIEPKITDQKEAPGEWKKFAGDLVRQTLEREIALRQSHNPSYSMRAFARDIKVPQPTLANVLAGRQCLSTERVLAVSNLLHLDPRETDLLVQAARASSTRNKKGRQSAGKKLLVKLKKSNPVFLDSELFAQISSWQYFAIIELLKTKNIRKNTEDLSKVLGIEEQRVEECLDVLVRTGRIVNRNNEWLVNEQRTTIGGDTPNSAIRSYHRSIIARGVESLEKDDPTIREFGNIVFPLNKSQVVKLKELLREFRRGILDEFESESGDAVYSLNMQLFPLADLTEIKNATKSTAEFISPEV